MKISRVIWRFIRVVLLVAATFVLLFLTAVDKLQPRQLFTIGIPVLAILSTLISITLIRIPIRWPGNIPKGRDFDNAVIGYIHDHLLRSLSFGVIFILLVSL